MIYTCFEMIRDCREGRPEGWSYFIANYVPVVEKLIGHYRPGSRNTLDPVLASVCSPGSDLFAGMDPAPERPFVAELRQQVLVVLDRIAPQTEPDIIIDLETLSSAVEGLTLLEKQAAWFETMFYSPTDTGTFLHTAPPTIEKIREKAAEGIRVRADGWRATVLAENGRQLGRQAAMETPQCLPQKAFLDVLDGRATWRGREALETHVRGCWHCIDHFCRMMEVVKLLRQAQPLSATETEPFRKLLGLAAEKRPPWKRLFKAG
jgi:hypothetical protein